MKKINLKPIFLLAATAGLLIFLHFLGWLVPAERALYFVFNPIASNLQSWSGDLSRKYSNSVREGDLAVQLTEAEKEIEALRVENASLRKMQDENSVLRQHLKFLENGNAKKYLLASVVSRQILNDSEESLGDLVVNKGSDDGVISGLAVLDETGAVVGKVTDVQAKVSRVTLITDSNCKMAATLQNTDRTIGLTKGDLGLTINMNYIPQVESIAVGDVAVTSGLESNIPRGLLIGQVAKVDKGSNDIWQSANIQPAANLDNLTIVSILLP
jgi:rod shape-determining protein MreC